VCREGKQIIPTLNIYITPMRLLEVKAKRFLTAGNYQPMCRQRKQLVCTSGRNNNLALFLVLEVKDFSNN